MPWSHLLVAADDSRAGLHALDTAEGLATRIGARVTVLTVLPNPAAPIPEALRSRRPVVATGVPAIEIVRVADEIGARAIVLGRTVAGSNRAPRLGATGDAVVRRSRVPCLLVPLEQEGFEHLIVAVDGTERGLVVLRRAREFAGTQGGQVDVVTVERGDRRNAEPPVARMRIQEAMGKGGPVRVLTGNPVDALRSQLDQPLTDLLVIGARRGGPSGFDGSTGTGRTMLYTAPCAVLTIPL